MAEWKAGDLCWRGYARNYGNPKEWWPEIRPGRVTAINTDGSLSCTMEGVIPGAEGKRNPGSWVAWSLRPVLLHRTPEDALRAAKTVADDLNASATDDAA